ncbi:MAG: DivIVA domain-containing protein [Ignavibacteriaceae bacterium]
MKLSPLLIKKQEFQKAVRGYNVEEVQAFLEKVASDMEELLNEKEALEKEVQKFNEKVSEFQKLEKNLQDTLIKAQDSSVKTLESAKSQTNLLIKEAEIKASQIIENARKDADEIRNAVMTLRDEKDLIIARLKAIVNTQANVLEGKVVNAGEEKKKQKTPAEREDLDIDVDGIVDKLL